MNMYEENIENLKGELSQREEVKKLVRKIIGGFQFVFIAISIGIFCKHATGWEWVQDLIDWCIFIFMIALIVIKRLMDKKAQKEQRGET